MSKIAAIQMRSANDVDENLKTTRALIAKASKEGAKLIVLPEMFAIFGVDQAMKVKTKEHFGTGKIQTFLANEAKKHGVWLVAGTIPLESNHPDKIRSACLLLDNEGKVVARYDKMHLFDVTLSSSESYKESITTEPGDKIIVIPTPFGKLGIAVCYDIRFPGLFMQLFKQGAEIIAIPAAFTMKTGEAHWRLLARTRAIENLSYVIGACQSGIHENGRQTYGHSLIVDPWGTVIEEILEPGPGIIYADINLKYLHNIRATLPVKEHTKDYLNLAK